MGFHPVSSVPVLSSISLFRYTPARGIKFLIPREVVLSEVIESTREWCLNLKPNFRGISSDESFKTLGQMTK